MNPAILLVLALLVGPQASSNSVDIEVRLASARLRLQVQQGEMLRMAKQSAHGARTDDDLTKHRQQLEDYRKTIEPKLSIWLQFLTADVRMMEEANRRVAGAISPDRLQVAKAALARAQELQKQLEQFASE